MSDFLFSHCMMLLMNGGYDGGNGDGVDEEYDDDDNNATSITVDKPGCNNPRPKSSLDVYLGRNL